jgi:hypothetical protein
MCELEKDSIFYGIFYDILAVVVIELALVGLNGTI